jgi:hypothetical protein
VSKYCTDNKLVRTVWLAKVLAEAVKQGAGKEDSNTLVNILFADTKPVDKKKTVRFENNTEDDLWTKPPFWKNK